MKIGKNIRTLREIKNFSQSYMADMLHVSQRTFSSIENDQTSLTLERLFLICEILDCELSDLLAFDQKNLFEKSGSFKDGQVDLLARIEFLEKEISDIKEKLK